MEVVDFGTLILNLLVGKLVYVVVLVYLIF